MTAAVFDLVIEQGATFQQTFVWTDNSGAPIDLSGYTARMMVKTGFADTVSSSLLSLSTTAGTISITASTGSIAISVPASTTQALTFSKAVYDLELVSGSGVVTRLVQGNVTLNKEVTR